MHFPCPGQENELVVVREKQIGHNEDMKVLAWNRTLTTIQSLWHPSIIHGALMNTGASIRREHIRPLRREAAPASLYRVPGWDADLT